MLGHEFMGVVDAVGPAVTKFKKGDRAVASFEMGCGQCYFCKHGQFSSCDTTNPRYDSVIHCLHTILTSIVFQAAFDSCNCLDSIAVL